MVASPKVGTRARLSSSWAPRLRRRRSVARRGDRGCAPARAVLRRVHDRVGEHDRDRARVAVGGLLARRPVRGPASGQGRPLRARLDRRARGRGRALRRGSLPRRVREGARRPVRRRLHRIAAGRDRPDRSPGGAARGGVPLRGPARREHRGGERLGRGPHVRDLDRRQPGRHLRLGAGPDPARSGRGAPSSSSGCSAPWSPSAGVRRRVAVAVPATILAAGGASRRHDQGQRGRARAGGGRDPSSVRARGRGARTESGSSSSTRGRRSTLCIALAPTSPATTGTGSSCCPSRPASVPPRKVAILGNAAGTTARAMGHFFPGATVDAVEIDSELTRLGRRWFDLRNPRMTVHHEDARPFLRRSEGGYDSIFVDVYRQPYIPFYLDDARVLRARPRQAAPRWLGGRQRRPSRGPGRAREGPHGHDEDAFASVARDPVEDTNTLLVASDEPLPAEARGGRRPPAGRAHAGRARVRRAARRHRSSGGPVYTDDRAPVEWLVDRSIVDYAATGE